MPTFNPFPVRYRSIKSSITDSNPLVIDTEANPQDILEAALQRIRASSQLLETLHSMTGPYPLTIIGPRTRFGRGLGSQKLALRRVTTQRQTGGGDHEPDPVGATQRA